MLSSRTALLPVLASFLFVRAILGLLDKVERLEARPRRIPFASTFRFSGSTGGGWIRHVPAVHWVTLGVPLSWVCPTPASHPIDGLVICRVLLVA